MYAAPGIPSGIIERTDAASLRQDALRLCEKIRACEDVARALDGLTGTVRSLHARTDGDAQASLTDTLAGKIKAWRTLERRPSKALKNLGDIARLVEAYPELAAALPEDAARAIAR